MERKTEFWSGLKSLPQIRLVSQAFGAGKLAILELLLPPACRLCNGPIPSGEDFCRTCEVSLTVTEAMMATACARCGMPHSPLTVGVPQRELDSLGNLDSTDQDNAKTAVISACSHCRDRDLGFHRLVGLWAYRDRVCEAIVAAKYAYNTPLADAMGRRLGLRVQQVFGPNPPDQVTFVPSHVTRQFSRGGIGTRTIAEAVARIIGRPCRPLLRTTRRIAKQAWLDDLQREKNVRDAFSMKKRYALSRPPQVANRHILVVDDVLTTGATANEICRVLRTAGARQVSLAVIARAIRSQ